MDAMASQRTTRRLKQLWQLPLLIISLGLFVFAAYLFIDPKRGPTIDDKIGIATGHLSHDRPKAAIDQLNLLIKNEKLDQPHEAKIHLMLGEAIQAAQVGGKLNLVRNHENIIDQTRAALALGAQADFAVYKRLGESFQALGRAQDAVKNYREALRAEPKQTIAMEKRIIEIQSNLDDRAAESLTIEDYLGHTELSATERAWAQGEMAHLLIDRGNFSEARSMLNQALKIGANDPVQQGVAHYWLGYCGYKLGENEEAERFLRASRDEIRTQHPLDGEASYYLGKIQEAKHEPASANSFFDVVLINHPDSRLATLSRLGRGVNRITLDEDDAGLTDLHDVVGTISQKGDKLIKYKEETLAGLRRASANLIAKGNYTGATEVLGYEQELEGEPSPEFWSRLALVYERRAKQIDSSVRQDIGAKLQSAELAKRTQQVRELRVKAADAYIAYSRAMTLKDDARYGEALWKGIQLYNQCGDLPRVIAALEVFAAERPDDSLTPDALLQLGQAYQAAADFDKAIATFQRNQFRYPKSLAASKSAVPLAMALIAKGSEFYPRAESVLKEVLDSPVLTPEAQEFRQSLLELAQLYYRTGRFEDAIARLEELTQRYPQDERLAELMYLMADSYRKSAGLLKTQLASTKDTDALQQASNMAEASKAKKDRLSRARQLYDKAIGQWRSNVPATDLEKLYCRLSHFYRADCEFDLGNYANSIKLYDAAAFRYQEDPSALAAYVQIVNANCALGKMEEAKTANERAKTLLRRMPADAFKNGSLVMPKEYWEKWLKWSGETGMW